MVRGWWLYTKLLLAIAPFVLRARVYAPRIRYIMDSPRVYASHLFVLVFTFLSSPVLRFLSFYFLSACSHWSSAGVPLIFSCPADHVPDLQPCIAGYG